MTRTFSCGLMLAALALGFSAETADAAVVRARQAGAVAVRPGPLPSTAVQHKSATAVRATPWRPLAGPQAHHASQTTRLRIR